MRNINYESVVFQSGVVSISKVQKCKDIASEVFNFFFFFFFFLEEVLPKFTLILLFYFHLIDSFTNQKKKWFL